MSNLELPRPYWLGWPGTTCDLDRHQRDYAARLRQSTQRLGVALEQQPEPIDSEQAVADWIGKIKADPPDGLLVMLQHMQTWPCCAPPAMSGATGRPSPLTSDDAVPAS